MALEAFKDEKARHTRFRQALFPFALLGWYPQLRF